MSLRAMRILAEQQKADGEERERVDTGSSEESEEEEEETPFANPFDLLGSDGEEESESVSDNEVVEFPCCNERDEGGTCSLQEGTAGEYSESPDTSACAVVQLTKEDVSGKAKGKKKKEEQKNNRRGKEGAGEKKKTTCASTGKKRKKPKGKGKEEEDIDALLLEIDGKLPGDPGDLEHNVSEKLEREKEEALGLVAVSASMLSSENELKRLFGRKALASDRRERNQGRRLVGGHQSRGGRERRMKKKLLVQHKDTWPLFSSGGGLSMEKVGRVGKKGASCFNLVWNSGYRRLQDQFFACVDTGDPNTIAEVVQFHPYHIDSLVQLCGVLSHSGENERAMDMLERALYSFEETWHPLFRPVGSKQCLFPWDYEENRVVIIALFRHILMLGDKGCSRTALEWCKLLLGFDPNDPCGTIMLIDHYAIRCKEYHFLVDFAEKAGSLVFEESSFRDIALMDLPNYAFSVPLAKYHLYKEANREEPMPSELEECSELLQRALVLFPQLLNLILDQCPIRMSQANAQGVTWEHVSKHRFFANTTITPDNFLAYLIPLYKERNSSLWRAADVLEWLKMNAKVVCDKVDERGEDSGLLDEWLQSPSSGSAHEGILRHVVLLENGEAIRLLPAGAPRTFSLYHSGRSRSDVIRASTANPFSLFLSTLVPWGQIPNAPPEGMEDAVPPEWIANMIRMVGAGDTLEQSVEEASE